MMIKIDYPPYQPRIKKENGKEFIFETIRKRWLILTPEEWVRQNFIQYLVQVKKYPATLIAAEKEIKLGDLTKRFDIVVYNTSTRPFMLIECKEMNVELSEKVLEQALRYNISLPVPYIIITNGSHTAGLKNDNGKVVELFELPEHI